MKKLAVTIAGGGVRSTVGIGVLEYLEENNIQVDAISGSSAGAIIAILYGYGVSIKEIKEIVEEMNFKDFLNIQYNSLLSLKSMEKMLKARLAGRTQQIPIEIAITNQKTMKPEYIREGNLIKAVIASASLKVFFKSVKIDNEKYRDGGYSNNLPYINFHNEGYYTIAVKARFSKLKKRRFHKKVCKTIKYPDLKPDLLIKVDDVGHISTFELTKTSFIVESGYKKAKEEINIEELKKELK